MLNVAVFCILILQSSESTVGQIPFILLGGAVLYMTTHLFFFFFVAFRSVFTLVSRDTKDLQGVSRELKTLGRHGYFWQ